MQEVRKYLEKDQFNVIWQNTHTNIGDRWPPTHGPPTHTKNKKLNNNDNDSNNPIQMTASAHNFELKSRM